MNRNRPIPEQPRCDQALLRECRWEAFRGPGPGGQKRNKTSSAIRVTHEPSGLCAIAMESRSQRQNRARALERLKHRMALELRQPVDLDQFVAPGWFTRLLAPGHRLRLSSRRAEYLPVVSLVLDVLVAVEGSVSAAAGRLDIGSANLVDFFQRDEKLLTQVNRIRNDRGLRGLGA